jgi:hypothetical protein
MMESMPSQGGGGSPEPPGRLRSIAPAFKRTIMAGLGVMIFFFAGNDFGGTEIPIRYAFVRYDSLLHSTVFAPPSPAAPANFSPGDLYIENVRHTPEGDLVTLRSIKDPNFSMTMSAKPPKLLPTSPWKLHNPAI